MRRNCQSIMPFMILVAVIVMNLAFAAIICFAVGMWKNPNPASTLLNICILGILVFGLSPFGYILYITVLEWWDKRRGDPLIDSHLTDDAYDIMHSVHKDARDKGGNPYADHPVTLTWVMDTEDEVCTALLHDVIEDASDPEAMRALLHQRFPSAVCNAVEALTRPDGVTYADYIDNLKTDRLAAKVKLADLAHNMNLERIPENARDQYLSLYNRYHRAADTILAYWSDDPAMQTHWRRCCRDLGATIPLKIKEATMSLFADVRIATTREGYDTICAFVDAAKKNPNERQLIGAQHPAPYFINQYGCVVFGWDVIKWGPLYQNVNVIYDALQELAAKRIPWQLCCIYEPMTSRFGTEDDIDFTDHDLNHELKMTIKPQISIGLSIED